MRIGNYLSSSFPIENVLKQGDALSPTLDMNDVNLICDDIGPVGRNAEVLVNDCKDIGLAVNTGKISTWK